MFGWSVIGLVFGGLLLWSIFAPFEGAILTSGQITVESNQQAVQHLEGGIVRQIYVREGDTVEAGQRLISLDPTTTDAGVDAVEARLFELLGTEARLIAEQNGQRVLGIRSGFEEMETEPEMIRILDAQNNLALARRDARRTQTSIFRQQIEQLRTRIDGMGREILARERQIDLLEDEIGRFEILREKGLAPEIRILALKREKSVVESEKDSLTSNIAAINVQIGEARSEISKLDQTFREDVLTELRNVQTQIEELAEQRTTAKDRQFRQEITAPRAGRVIGVRAHTIGGVITPSEPIMFVVPEGDRLIAKVRIMPMDIDKVSIGQTAKLRFTAFNMDESPEVDGAITQVSPDALTDQATGMSYYEAIVEIPDASLLSERFELLPGMPVDALVLTESRSVLSYLVKPLQDAVSRTFRE
jgi:HlyD family secretion protein/epimerase transport system membrane fusion protein